MPTNVRPPGGGETQGAPRKKPYAKPAVTRIRLQAEEAVLGACKTSATGAGMHPSGCRLCGISYVGS
jgi:hypothetical protein